MTNPLSIFSYKIWGNSCIIYNIYISWLEFTLIIVSLSSLIAWRSSIEIYEDNNTDIVFFISTICFFLSVFYNNCCNDEVTVASPNRFNLVEDF